MYNLYIVNEDLSKTFVSSHETLELAQAKITEEQVYSIELVTSNQTTIIL